MGLTASEDEHRIGGRYRLVEGLGRGGMGSVWRAFDERLNRTVAVKVLDPAQSPDDQGRVEALALAQLNHPHIANVYDYGEEEGRPYLVMELAPGQSLAAILAGGPMGWRAATAAAAHVASALAAAHERGLVHRDVKPGNIMVTPTGAKLIDFGISAVEGEAEADPDGGIRGTPAYVAPERLRGRPVAAPADVYALGVVLYRALSGRLPWEAGNAGDYWTERERADPRPLLATDGLPAAVADLCRQCLAVDPARRPDAATVARVLTQAAGPEGFGALELLAASQHGDGEATQLMAPVSQGGSKRGRWVATARAGAAAAAVAGVLALVWSTVQWSPVSDDGIPETLTAVGPEQPQPPACAVTFRLAADDGQRFAADIVATARTESFPSGWRLSLPLPPDGIDVDEVLGWTREGAMLVSPEQPTLGVGRLSQLALAGSHSGGITLPTSMSVDGRDCAVDLIASTAAPASPPLADSQDQPSSQPSTPTLDTPPPPPASADDTRGRSDASRPGPPDHARGRPPSPNDQGDEDEDN